MGPNFIYLYHVNTIGSEYDWTCKSGRIHNQGHEMSIFTIK